MEIKEILKPGTELFGYRVVEFVGKGTWAYVYKAQHPSLSKRLVAIKQLKPKFVENESALQRFLSEANIVSQIDHPNVVTIHDFKRDLETGYHYIFTQFAEKGDLADRLQESPEGLPIDEILHIASGICNGLEAVHRRGVVHRDIKPGNILLCDAGESLDLPKVSDFGIAKELTIEGAGTTTTSSGAYGSLFYISPEQLNEEIEVDGRADLYSVGILLYELITGQVPFAGEINDVFMAHMMEPPTPPSRIRSDVPKALEQVVMQALRKDRKDRYQSAADMHEALEAIKHAPTRERRQAKSKALIRQGFIHLNKEEWEAAIEVLRQADVLAPGNERVQEALRKAGDQKKLQSLYNKGLQYQEVGNWEEAQNCLAQVMSYDPDYKSGQIEEQLEQATQELEQERKQHDSTIRYLKGMGYFRKWQWTRVIAEMEPVVNGNPDLEDAATKLEAARQYIRAGQLFEQVQSYKEQGKWEKAIDLLEEIGVLKPPHIRVAEELEEVTAQWVTSRGQQQLVTWYDEGITELGAGNLGPARMSFQKIYDRQPDYRDVADRLEEISKKSELNQLFEQLSKHETAGEWEEAIGVCREILRIDPRNREAGRCLARAQKRADRPSLAPWTHLIAAFIAGVVCTTFTTWLMKEIYESSTQLVLSILFSMLIFVPPFYYLIQWLVAQRIKTTD